MLILLLHQHLGLQSVCFLEVFCPKTLCALLLRPMCATLRARLSFHDGVYEQENLIEFWLNIAGRILRMRVRGLVLRLHVKSVVLCRTGSSDLAPLLMNIVTC